MYRSRLASLPIDLVFTRSPAAVLEERWIPTIPPPRTSANLVPRRWARLGRPAWYPYTFPNGKTVLWPIALKLDDQGTVIIDFMDGGMENFDSENDILPWDENFGVAAALRKFVPAKERGNFESKVTNCLADGLRRAGESHLTDLVVAASIFRDKDDGWSSEGEGGGGNGVAVDAVAAQLAGDAAQELIDALRVKVHEKFEETGAWSLSRRCCAL